MPIVTLGPDAGELSNTTTIPEVLQAPSKSNFTTLFPANSAASLLKYTEGYPWEVHYYGQILSTANSLSHVDPTIPTLLQPYYEVRGLVIQVSSPLSSSYDEETGTTTATGSALAPHGVKPNAGDIFISSVDSGEDAIFIITSVTRKTHRKDTLYEISYALFKYVSADPVFMASLQAKIQDTYFFNKEGKSLNKDVLITPTFKEAQDRCRHFVSQSMDYYFQMFASRSFGTLIIPGTEAIFYDPLLLSFITKTVPYDVLMQHKLYSFTVADRYHSQSNFFDLLLSRNKHLHTTINKTYGFVNTASLRNHSRMGTIFHAGVDAILYPKSPDRRLDVSNVSVFSPVDTFATGYLTAKNNTEIPLTIQTSNNNQLFTKRMLPVMFDQDCYIVNNSFYDYLDDTAAYSRISYFELLVAKFIKREAISLHDLALLIERYERWSLLQQMYLLPVVWIMISASL